jgi:hypothetical protein
MPFDTSRGPTFDSFTIANYHENPLRSNNGRTVLKNELMHEESHLILVDTSVPGKNVIFTLDLSNTHPSFIFTISSVIR